MYLYIRTWLTQQVLTLTLSVQITDSDDFVRDSSISRLGGVSSSGIDGVDVVTVVDVVVTVAITVRYWSNKIQKLV